MWEEVLGAPHVGLDDDLLELGGHSLTIIKILVRVEERFGVRLSPQEFIECRTVGNLAALVETRVLKNFEDAMSATRE
jgi:acyl carrier protein